MNCRVRVFLNCVEKHSEMPLKSFYRLVLEPDLMFGADERMLAGPLAKFGVLPLGALLTQNLQVPDNWLVESVWSPYDLDNIRLDSVDTDVHSEYELEHLILEGHCFDQATGSPPRGLQLTLGTPLDPIQVDTIVMANLGYLQLKVKDVDLFAAFLCCRYVMLCYVVMNCKMLNVNGYGYRRIRARGSYVCETAVRRRSTTSARTTVPTLRRAAAAATSTS